MQAQELRDAGKEPYAYRFDRTHLAAALHEQFKDLPDGEVADLQVVHQPLLVPRALTCSLERSLSVAIQKNAALRVVTSIACNEFVPRYGVTHSCSMNPGQVLAQCVP
jgi:lysyl-tRNA synthetase class II